MAKVLLPSQLELASGERVVERLLLEHSAAIYRLDDQSKIVVVTQELANFWVKHHYLSKNVLSCIKVGEEEFLYLKSESHFVATNLAIGPGKVDISKALSITYAFRNSIEKPGSIKDSFFVEKYSMFLPFNTDNDLDDELSFKTWLANGVKLEDDSFSALLALMPLREDELIQCLKLAGVSCSAEPPAQRDSKDIDKFELFGRDTLESFINEYIIDVVNNLDSYQRMGITGPASFILYGPPGCGKTYAAEKLSNHLDWPIFKIDSASVASPYIHETSKKISETFDKAIKCTPSVILIDEMESYTSNRSSSKDHKLEEVNEFLRRIPEAISAGVLIIGMTNFIEDIDPALKRKGRFDHLIELGVPNEKEIRTTLQYLTKSLPLANQVIGEEIVKGLSGRTLADVAFVVKEAARISAKNRATHLGHAELMSAIGLLPPLQSTSRNKIGFL